MTKSKLRLTEIWKTEFIFQDIYDEASKEFKDYVDSLPIEELAEFIDSNLQSWAKSFEAGIMSNWDVVAQTVASNTDLQK